MKHIKYAFSAIIIALSQTAWAFDQTDFKCMSDCQSRGYMYGYCKKQCSF